MADNYLITGYWGEPHVTAENDRGINAAIFGPGRFVLPVGKQFQAEYIGNSTIRVYDGKLVDNGAVAGIPAGKYVDLQISETGQGMTRNDLIVFQYEKNTSTLVESGKFIVVKGTETNGTATDPALTHADLLSDTATLDQMALWRVSVSTATIAAPVKMFSVLNHIQNVNEDAIPKNHAVNSTIYGAASANAYGHAKSSNATPKANGAASAGSEIAVFSRGDHVHPEQVSVHGVTTAGDGSVYTATVEGITALTSGASFIMIPNVDSTASSCYLNVNGLGAKVIRRLISGTYGTSIASSVKNWIKANIPVRVTYNGTYWIADMYQPNANDIYGTMRIASGGTGGTTAEEARANLGVASMEEIPYMHVWKTTNGKYAVTETESKEAHVSFAGSSGGVHGKIDYADEIAVSGGVISLVNPTTIAVASKDLLQQNTIGKYVYSYTYSKFFRIASDSNVVQSGSSAYGYSLYYTHAYELTVQQTGEQMSGFAVAKEKDAYPASGEHTDGFAYEYIGQFGERPYTYGTADLTAGVSELETGKLYIVYE